MLIETPASRDPAIAKITLYGPRMVARAAVNSLLDSAHNHDPFVFAGHHLGMPASWVWAITRDGEPIEPYVDRIAGRVGAVTEETLQNAPRMSAIER